MTVAWLAAVLLLAAMPAPVAAHEGHDDPEPIIIGPSLPRAEAASDDFEVVAVLADRQLTIYLDRFATNETIAAATIAVSAAGGDPVYAEAQPDGSFVLRAKWLNNPGKHDLSFTVIAEDTTDLLAATLDIPQTEAAAPATPVKRIRAWLGSRAEPVALGLAVLLGGLITLGARAGSRRRLVIAAFALAVGLLIGGVAFADEAPRRRPDGAVVMPKDAQRLLAVRTVLGQEVAASRTVEIIGQIIADPTTAGRVQSGQPGRIEAGDTGLAHLGKRVQAGELLAVIAPAIGAMGRGAVAAQLAETEQQIRLAEQKLTRLASLTGSVAGKDLDEARAELAGARARRIALVHSVAGREELRAPVSGIVAVANAVIGQFVEGKDILFEIVDPARLWVEATGFDPGLAGAQGRASALLADGAILRLDLVGRGLSLRQGATPMVFRIQSPPSGLSIGTPVTVMVLIGVPVSGISLPRSAIIRLPNGGAGVWDHVSAERFVPRPVRIQPLDGANTLVLAGIKPASRIVVQGADLLNQVR
ncbi:MAG: efflux RND transporter periplasmic adaptor subunit [Acetobacteraceae bacterium]|nr:efflux RND transporter periplasmic adaptor subunit [Acetobacteraceae bacterium]